MKSKFSFSFLTICIFSMTLGLLLFNLCLPSEDQKFESYSRKLFLQEVSSNTLNLHYTLSDPAAYHLEDLPVSFGSGDLASLKQQAALTRKEAANLSKINRSRLSADHQLTYDILSLVFSTETKGDEFLLYQEPFAPVIGIQAQLPTLLAEYHFQSEKDVQDYLRLLSQVDEYFENLLSFEQEKAKAGLFMSQAADDKICAQCDAFLSTGDQHFLVTSFQERIKPLNMLSEDQKHAYEMTNQDIIENQIFPAYETIKRTLTALRNSSTNQQGLCWFPNGKAYYEYLLKSSTGVYDTIPKILAQIKVRLLQDLYELSRYSSSATIDTTLSVPSEPLEILKTLQQSVQTDFPSLPALSCTIKYVAKSMEDYLSPAFYLSPPLDDFRQNVIYINQGADYTSLELYLTLAHEGWPGHLYQTIHAANTFSDPLRSLLSFPGYSEGWATYAEFTACENLEKTYPSACTYRLNRSFILGISSYLDILIHYYGYSLEDTNNCLEKLGLSTDSASDLYTTILSSPCNYLKYYLGFLSFDQLKQKYLASSSDSVTLKTFHEKLLSIGPAPFPVLNTYLFEKK